MFSGGNDDAQAPQDNMTTDQTTAPTDTDTDAQQPVGGVPMPDLTQPEAAELPAIVPPADSADPVDPVGPSDPVDDVTDDQASIPSTPAVVAATDDLLGLKQQALQQLTPLLGHLDQSADERFRTTMMMIQASDNSSLLKDAYAAAQQIEDEKTRAQALLDVVNEINYFTQHEGGPEPTTA